MASLSEGALLSERQSALLDELSAAVGSAGSFSAPRAANSPEEEAEPTGFEAFHQHWQLVRARHRGQEALKRRGRWRWICGVQEICEAACGELDGILAHLTELDGQRGEVLRKTTALHERCEQMVQDQERMGASAEALAERLDLFDRVADVARVLDHQAACGLLSVGGAVSSSAAADQPGLGSGASDFVSVLDQLDGSITFLEAHPDFCQAQAYMHQFEHLRNRACLAIRSTLQRSLEKSSTQVEAQLKESAASQGATETQVFYTRFHAAALDYRPLMSLLQRRLDMHETYAVTLEELEGFYVHLRLRLLSGPVSAHLQSVLHSDLKMSELAPATRQASSYILEISRLEKRCFEAYFELRQPQEALRTLLETLADVFYRTMRPIVLSCDSIDSLREIADSLQMDVLEPHRQSSKGDLVPVMAVVYRLHKDVQEKLIYRVEMYIRDSIKGYEVSSSDLNYPSALFSAESSGEDAAVAGPDAGGFQKGWFPTLTRTLSILAKIYRVLEMSTFQGLAQEAVDICIATLKQASEQLAQRRLPWAGKDLEVLKPLVQMMDSQLFLVKHLLLLREQVAAFECDLVVSEKFFNFAGVWEALNLKLPNGLLGILKPTVYHSQVDSKKDIEAELKGACESLITNLTAHITQPLGVLNTQIGDFLAVPGVDRSKLREQTFMQPDQLRDTIGGFLANVRGRVPFAASHIRLYLSGGSDASGIDDGSGRSRAGAQQSTSPILFKPVQIRLVDSWGRLEGLLEEQSFSAEELEALGFIRPDALRELVTSLFNMVMEAPWEMLVQTVSQVPRSSEAAPAAPTPAIAAEPTEVPDLAPVPLTPAVEEVEALAAAPPGGSTAGPAPLLSDAPSEDMPAVV